MRRPPPRAQTRSCGIARHSNATIGISGTYKGLLPHGVRWTDMRRDVRLAPRVEEYVYALVRTCAQIEQPLVSLILFGSAASGGFSNASSDVDLVIVVPDDQTSENKRRLRAEIVRLEIAHGLRPAQPHGGLQARVERAVGHLFSCFICTRSELISGDVARILDLRRWESIFVDRILLASIITSAVTVQGEDLLRGIRVPPLRRLDVFKALFGFSCQIVLILEMFPFLPDATKYAMGVLKHSVHSCFFCYHRRTGDLDEEVDFLNRRLSGSGTLGELLSLRRQYRKSFGFVIRCLPTLVKLHRRTARDNRFAASR